MYSPIHNTSHSSCGFVTISATSKGVDSRLQRRVEMVIMVVSSGSTLCSRIVAVGRRLRTGGLQEKGNAIYRD